VTRRQHGSENALKRYTYLRIVVWGGGADGECGSIYPSWGVWEVCLEIIMVVGGGVVK